MIKQVVEEKTILDSKLVEYILYNHGSKQLDVKYKSGKNKGKVKKYYDIDSSAVDYVIQSSSPGKALISALKQIEKEKASKSFFHRMLSYIPFI